MYPPKLPLLYHIDYCTMSFSNKLLVLSLHLTYLILNAKSFVLLQSTSKQNVNILLTYYHSLYAKIILHPVLSSDLQ